jgi:hypothetical protein
MPTEKFTEGVAAFAQFRQYTTEFFTAESVGPSVITQKLGP